MGEKFAKESSTRKQMSFEGLEGGDIQLRNVNSESVSLSRFLGKSAW